MKRFLAWAVLILGGLATFFRQSSKRHQAEAARHKERADQQSAVNETRNRIDNNLTELEQKQREQQEDEEERLAAGRRDHFDNNW
ncbi:MAG: hypothetical protein SV201_04935 [Pseudomonadota bacterium]|nr:hypothetical protein [Pseudomonadota bacterium]